MAASIPARPAHPADSANVNASLPASGSARPPRRRTRATPGSIATLLLTMAVAILVLFPLFMLLYGSFWSARPGFPGELTFDNYITAYTDPFTYRLFLNTIGLMAAKTALATALAVTMAWIVARTDAPMRGMLEVLVIFPFFVPGLLEAIGWVALLSPRAGVLNVFLRESFGLGPINIYSMGGMIWVMTLSSTSLIFLLVVTAFRNMDASMEEAARASGAGQFKTAITVTLPLMAPVILNAAVLSFIRAMDSFEVPVLLGLPAKVYLFTNQIYSTIQYDVQPNYGLATTYGISLFALMIVLIVIHAKLLSGKEFTVITGKGYRPQTIRLGRYKYLAFGFCVLYFLLAGALPVSQIVLGSFQKVFGLFDWNTLTLDNYRNIFREEGAGSALLNTVVVGTTAAFFTMVLGGAIAYITTRTNYPGRRVLDVISWLPWSVPGVVLGIGMLWAYIRTPLYGTHALLFVAFLTTGLPVAVRLMSGVLQQVGRELEESSRVHGAGWWYTLFHVLLPLLNPAIMAGALILFVGFSRTVSTVVLFSSQGTELLSVLLFAHVLTGELQVGSALAVILLLANLAAVYAARRLGALGTEVVR